MLNPISNKIENVWESWSIRVVIGCSLSLQIFLTICSPLRKRMNNIFIQIFIWIAYLMADIAAIFCVGHIASSQVSSNIIKINTQNHLLAFWAPFLLVHLGGPDTITALSLEDNQLWMRHMLGFITQLIFCAYVFLLTVPGNRLWIPTVLVFVAGIIKYGERIYAMYLATHIPKPDPIKILDFDSYENVFDIARSSDLSQVQVLVRAINPHVDQPINYMDTPRFNFRVVEVMMNFNYDKFFNKFLLSYGYLCRLVTISCLLTALGLFLFEDKQYKLGFNPFDIRVTYTLMCGAVALDIIGLFMQFFSDRVIAFFPRLIAASSFMRSILELKRTRWSKCKKDPYTKFTQLSTLLPFRKWSESISGFNLISYRRYMMRKQPSWLQYFDMFSGGTIFKRLNVVKNPFLLELWEFIFDEFGSGYSTDIDLSHIYVSQQKLIPYIRRRDITFGMLIIMWHIATHLCYVQELDDQVNKREFSKLLSDYMMYLLVLKSDMIPEADSSSIKAILDELKRYFTNGNEDEVDACKRFEDESARREEVSDFSLDNSNLCINACTLAKELGMISEASIKWEIISKIWVDFLFTAARESNYEIHIQHLSKGGELISLISLLREKIRVPSSAPSFPFRLKRASWFRLRAM